MQTNRRIFITGLILMIMTSLAAIIFWWSVKLDGPVFFEQYRERTVMVGTTSEGYPLYHQVTLHMPFVTDQSDRRIVERIEFPEVLRLDGMTRTYYETEATAFSFNSAQSQSQGSGKTIGRYSFNILTVSLDFLEKLPFGPEKITCAEVYYSNGESETVALGEIWLTGSTYEPGAIEHKSSSGSSDGTYEARFSVTAPVELIEAGSPLLDRYKESLVMDVNGMALSELRGKKLEAGDSLQITATLETGEGFARNYTLLEITPELSYKTEDGRLHSQRLLSIIEHFHAYDPEQFLDLVQYLKGRGAI
ncbi:hypothetical protein [Acidaminobacter hydrogenoformans]|uniref:Uncharacterized protein n=1 Tax=Acidaminobacter hydrogenoformans DSM 2784 TaxID=1120920 RepID=A0A1G5S6K1_9FIRM|nr:hypothetical protein [Acidaminobacter hydrogenoformans]SCZ81995.1 hypothetical protein SAMN03080599_03249 [Acidaminobacter hydrogenoformans DSM 2784]